MATTNRALNQFPFIHYSETTHWFCWKKKKERKKETTHWWY